MSEVSPEITCDSCEGLCCRNINLVLSFEEARKLREAGTKIAEILPAFRTQGELTSAEDLPSWSDPELIRGVLQDAAAEIDPKRKKALFNLAHLASEAARGDGIFSIDGVCGNLQPDNSCGDYENRPKICRNFVMDGSNCQSFRQEAGLDVIPIELTPKPL